MFSLFLNLVPGEGLEPSRLAAMVPKTIESAFLHPGICLYNWYQERDLNPHELCSVTFEITVYTFHHPGIIPHNYQPTLNPVAHLGFEPKLYGFSYHYGFRHPLRVCGLDCVFIIVL
jgi:hypothetical protein